MTQVLAPMLEAGSVRVRATVQDPIVSLSSGEESELPTLTIEEGAVDIALEFLDDEGVERFKAAVASLPSSRVETPVSARVSAPPAVTHASADSPPANRSARRAGARVKCAQEGCGALQVKPSDRCGAHGGLSDDERCDAINANGRRAGERCSMRAVWWSRDGHRVCANHDWTETPVRWCDR